MRYELFDRPNPYKRTPQLSEFLSSVEQKEWQEYCAKISQKKAVPQAKPEPPPSKPKKEPVPKVDGRLKGHRKLKEYDHDLAAKLMAQGVSGKVIQQ